jgi:hypothetical protein
MNNAFSVNVRKPFEYLTGEGLGNVVAEATMGS